MKAYCKIASTGSYLPERKVKNDDLTQFPPNARSLIVQKTGIRSRRYASEQESTSDLAYKAARACLKKVDFSPEDIDGIILATSSPDQMQPATAVRVQDRLGATNAFAFDINSVCSGSVYGFVLADALIVSGQYSNILFLASEIYSRILNPKDFRTFPYFGDGAGAIFFSHNTSGSGIQRSILGTDGSGCDVISVPGGGTRLPFIRSDDSRQAYFQMDGRKVYEFAVNKGEEIINELCIAEGISLKEIDLFICHQANMNILNEIARRLKVPEGKFYANLAEIGNTAAASVLIAIDEALTSGIIVEGHMVMAVSFGGGLSWGASLIKI